MTTQNPTKTDNDLHTCQTCTRDYTPDSARKAGVFRIYSQCSVKCEQEYLEDIGSLLWQRT